MVQAGRRGLKVAIAAVVVVLSSACGVTYHPGGSPAQQPVSHPRAAAVGAAPAGDSAAVAGFEPSYRLPVLVADQGAVAPGSNAPQVAGPTGSTPEPSAAAEPASASSTPVAPAAPAPPAPPDKLQPGDRSDQVLALQQRLNALGYLGGEPDGSYGDLTQQAVYAVQKAAGLERDGVAGPATLAAVASGIRPTARGTGDAVEVDLDKQLLLVVRAGKVVAIFNTSTGSGVAYSELIDGKTYTGDAQTYRGTFAVYREVNGPDKAPLGTLYRSKYFDGGIAVHGAPHVPPYPASHGCARVSNFAIDTIWEQGWMPIGSTVVVY